MTCSRSFWSKFTWLTAVLFVAVPGIAMSADTNPYARADDTWISLSGTVDSVQADSFMLDYGDGLVRVEMDDGDRDADGYKLMKGDKVSVSGKIDDDLFETTSIEASSVYVENLGTTFFASAVDEEDMHAIGYTIVTPIELSQIIARGTVTEVNDEEFVLDTGLRKIRVEVDEMPYNPLDDEGYQKIRKGDRVRVSGKIDNDLFEGRELVADSVMTLSYAAD